MGGMDDEDKGQKRNAEEIGRILRRSRKTKGMSAKQVGEKAGMNETVVLRIERGTQFPKNATRIKLTKVIGIPPIWLFPELKGAEDVSLNSTLIGKALEEYTSEELLKERRQKMLIASKDKNQFTNINNISSMFVNNDKRIVVATPEGRNYILDEYETREAALKAMEMLIDRIRTATEKTLIVRMPTDEDVETALIGQREYYRHLDGRKTKGHGGS